MSCHDDVLCTKHLNWIPGNPRLPQCPPDRPDVVDRQPMISVDGDRNCRPFPGTEALSASKAEKELDLRRIVDALLDEVTGVARDPVAGLLVGVGVNNLCGYMVRGNKLIRMATNQVHAIDPQEVHKHRSVDNDNRWSHLPSASQHS